MLTPNAYGFTLSWDRLIATYNTKGELVYAHYKRRGRLVYVSPKHCNVLAYARRQGEMQMESPILRAMALKQVKTP